MNIAGKERANIVERRIAVFKNRSTADKFLSVVGSDRHWARHGEQVIAYSYEITRFHLFE